MFTELQTRFGNAWCSVMHDSVMWPIHGFYECRRCGRRFTAFPETQGSKLGSAWMKSAAWKAAAWFLLTALIAALAGSAQAATPLKPLGSGGSRGGACALCFPRRQIAAECQAVVGPTP